MDTLFKGEYGPIQRIELWNTYTMHMSIENWEFIGGKFITRQNRGLE